MIKRVGSIAVFPAGLLLVSLLLHGCDYARMTDDEAVDTYETIMPTMESRAIPVNGGIEQLRKVDPTTLANPVPRNPESLEMGRIAYNYYCIHCHGRDADGQGTVGQSFAPLPANLKSRAVQKQTDGELFKKISLGSIRHPPLAYTVAAKDRWAIINYLRSKAAFQKDEL